MKTKTFDCIKMKDEGAARIYEETKDMSVEEKLEYWRKHTEALHEKQRRLSRERGQR